MLSPYFSKLSISHKQLATSGGSFDRFSLGASSADFTANNGGTYDEVGLWSRALTSGEIYALYNQGLANPYPFTLSSSTPSLAFAPNQGNLGTSPTLDTDYGTLPTEVQGNTPPAVTYPYATSTVATTTVNRLTVATTTTYTSYTPFSNYLQDSRGTKTTYLTLNGTLVGVYTYQTGQEASTGKMSYILTNYLGTPVLTTDDKGDIVEMGITDVYGNYVHRDTRKDTALRTKNYTSHEFDDTTGLVYAHARYLDTKAHTFMSVDPLLYSLPQDYLTDPQQMNSYAYARNNPVVYTDPTGLKSLSDIWNSVSTTVSNVYNSAITAVANSTPVNYIANTITGLGTTKSGTTALAVGASALNTGPSLYNLTNNVVKATTGYSAPKVQEFNASNLGVSSQNTGIFAGVALATDLGTAVFSPAKALAVSASKGKAFEQATLSAYGYLKNTQSINIGFGNKIPDILDKTRGVIGEIKNVNYQSLTPQLRTFIEYSRTTGDNFELYIRQNTKLSGPLQEALDSIGAAVIRR